MKTYYKVVQYTPLHLTSARAGDFGIGLNYIPNEWTSPRIPNSKIFVFDNLEDAERFKNEDEQIWECEVRNPRKAKYYSNIPHLDSFWSYSPSKRVAIYKKTDSKVPDGTIFADAVKLTKQVM